MLNTENQDVGATYDWARLPVEVYSIAPTTDYVGLSISKSWFVQEIEWNLDAYTGKATNYTRYYGREIRDGLSTPGSWFEKLDVRSSGLVLTACDSTTCFGSACMRRQISVNPAAPSATSYRPLAPGVGIYDLASGAQCCSVGRAISDHRCQRSNSRRYPPDQRIRPHQDHQCQPRHDPLGCLPCCFAAIWRVESLCLLRQDKIQCSVAVDLYRRSMAIAILMCPRRRSTTIKKVERRYRFTLRPDDQRTRHLLPARCAQPDQGRMVTDPYPHSLQPD